MVSNHFSFVVGDGKRTKFWKDSWYSDTSLVDAYPSLFTIARGAQKLEGVVGILLS